MSEPKTGWRVWHYWLLWILALFSLGLNVFMLVALNSTRQKAQQEITNVVASLDEIQFANVELPIEIDETLPLSMNVAYNDTFEVPINTTIPISTSIVVNDNISIPINDTVRVDRDVRVAVVILGQEIPVDIPLRADIPINLNVDVPVNLEVPVALEIPVDLMVEVPVNTEIPIDTEVPVQLSFPVSIPLDEFGINEILQQLKDGLNDLAASLGS